MSNNIRVEELCSEMYKLIREDFPDMTFAQFRELVRTPWQVLKEEMEKPTYIPVRMHYFGLFSISNNMALRGIKMADNALDKEKISEENYKEICVKMNNVIKYNEKFFGEIERSEDE